jgi:hypothetical protein
VASKRGVIVKKTIFVAIGLSLILLGFLTSCNLSGMSDVEFAKALMEESADSTGLYSAPSKSAGLGDDGLSISIVPISVEPPGPYIYQVTFTFTDYTPTFASNSIVDGSLTADITIDMDAETVTVDFSGTLSVNGEHAGEYIYTAQLIIYLATGEYEYSGKITTGGTVHDVTK